MKPTKDELRNRFLYHRPGPDALPKHAEVSRRSLEFAEWLTETCPDGRDLSLALTHLEDVRMRANAAIAMTQPLAD